MPAPDRSHAMDHVVLVLFENRSLDNLLGRLYGPEAGKTFEGVVRKDLSNPIPEWLFNTLDEHNRFEIGEAATAPRNVPPPAWLLSVVC